MNILKNFWPAVKDLKSFSIFLLIFLVLPNLINFLLAQHIDAERPVIIIDYLFASFPVLLLRKKSAYYYSTFIYLLFFCVDISLMIAVKFNFDPLKIFNLFDYNFMNWKFIKHLCTAYISNNYYFMFIAILVPVFMISFLICFPRLSRTNIRFSFYYFLIPAFFLILIEQLFDPYIYNYDLTYLAMNPAYFIEHKIDWSGMYGEKSEVTARQVNSASHIIFEKLQKNEKYDKIFMFVTESLGAMVDPVTQKVIFSPLDDKELEKHYNIHYSMLNTHGNTIQGEIRELCGFRLANKFPKADNTEMLKNCLPEVARSKGYEVTMMHNSSQEYYDRKNWYHYFNPDKIYFAEDMTDQFGLEPTCGTAFKCICEKPFITEKLSSMADNNSRQLFYFMTTEGHLPDDEERPISAEYRALCDKDKTLHDHYYLCKYTEVHYNFFKNIKSLALSLKDRKILIVIVGDHPIPVIRETFAKQVSKHDVPIVILESKK